MRPSLSILRGTVARRILGLFLVCALLPIGILAVLSLWEMSGSLKEQTESRLHQASKNVNMGILQGLYSLKGELELLSLSPEGLLRHSSREPEETIRSSLNQHFLGLTLFREGSEAETLFGTPCPFPPPTAGTRRHLADGNAHLFVRKVPEAPPRIYMVVSSDWRTPGKRILVGQIHPMYLEEIIENVMPAETDLVILDSTGALLYGQKPLSADVTRRVVDELRRTYSGQFEWTGGTRFLSTTGRSLCRALIFPGTGLLSPASPRRMRSRWLPPSPGRLS